MNRAKNLVVTIVSLGLLVALVIGLMGLFGAASRSQPVDQPPATTQAIEAKSTPTPQPVEPQPTEPEPTPTPVQAAPTSESHSAGILFESAGELYWQPVDKQGKATAAVAHVPIILPEKSKVGTMFPAPDGSQVVYEVYSPPPSGCCELAGALYVFSPPNGQPRQINPPATLAKIFGWHPNGRQLICGESRISLFDVNTGDDTLVAEPQKWADLPYSPQIDGLAFSLDGKKLITSFTLSGQAWEVWIANADGSDAKKLFDSRGAVFGFAWSPDGHHIAFVGPLGVEMITADGQNRTVVSRNFSVGWGFNLRWSLDSRFIAFAAYEKLPEYKSITEPVQKVFQYHKIHIVDVATGKEVRLVPDDTGGDIEPTWSPANQHIVFLSNRSGASEVWITTLNGDSLVQLTFDGRPKRSSPIWLPESKR